jgi:antitoxin (DNA-binding transcriptional repressor) of toxin-antitoxin stability system
LPDPDNNIVMTTTLIKKSDNLISMKKRMTATEVSRNFSAVIDAVAGGETVEVIRGKTPVALISPISTKGPNSLLLAKAISRHLNQNGPLSSRDASQRLKFLSAQRDFDLESNK